jgi:hypothetical protein
MADEPPPRTPQRLVFWAWVVVFVVFIAMTVYITLAPGF